MIIVKSLILLIITTINMAIIIYIMFLYVRVWVWIWTSGRASQYITTFVTLHVWFYNWLISIIIGYLSCPHHANKFSTVLTAYVIWYHSFCALKFFKSELTYVSLMPIPCKCVMNSLMFQLQTGQYLCVFISYKNTFP